MGEDHVLGGRHREAGGLRVRERQGHRLRDLIGDGQRAGAVDDVDQPLAGGRQVRHQGDVQVLVPTRGHQVAELVVELHRHGDGRIDRPVGRVDDHVLRRHVMGDREGRRRSVDPGAVAGEGQHLVGANEVNLHAVAREVRHASGRGLGQCPCQRPGAGGLGGRDGLSAITAGGDRVAELVLDGHDGLRAERHARDGG